MIITQVKREDFVALKYLILVSCIFYVGVIFSISRPWQTWEEFVKNGIVMPGMGYSQEYLPVKMSKNTQRETVEWLRQRGSREVQVISGRVEAETTYNNAPELRFRVEGEGEVELPRIYYLGYKIQNMRTGEVVEYKESENGMILAEVNDGEYRVSYEGTAGKVANGLAGVMVIGGGVGAIVKRRKKD